MRFKGFICIVALVPALAVAACGGDDGGEDFTAQADAVCTESAERINALFTKEGAPTSAEEAAALGAKLVGSRQQEIDELEALEPPEDLEAGYQDFVAARKEVLAGEESRQAADEQADRRASELAAAQVDEAFAAADEAAEGIGLEACAGILPPEEEDDIRAVAEQFFEAATREEFEVACRQATDAYIEQLGGIEACHEPGEPRTIEISEVGGVAGVSAEVLFVPTGGPSDGQNLRADFVYQGGEWKVDALARVPPPAEAKAPGGDESARGAYSQAVNDLAPATDVLFIEMDRNSGDLEVVQADARMLRDAFFDFDAELREISFPASLEEELNSLLEANGTVIADLDAIGEATSASEAAKLVNQATYDFKALYGPASATLESALESGG